MKVCLVVCLSLAHLAAASIFNRHHERPMQPMLPLTYIDPVTYSQLLDQVQYRESQKIQRPKEGYQPQYQKNSEEQKYQERSQPQRYENSQEQKYQERSQPQRYENSKEQKYQERFQPQRYENSQESQKYQDRSQEVLKTQESSWANEYLNPETAEVSSHEAEQIRVNIVEYQQQPLDAVRSFWGSQPVQTIPSYQKLPSEQQRSSDGMKQSSKRGKVEMKQNLPVAYGDNVEWNGIRMAVGPLSPIADQKEIARIFEDAYKTVKDFTEEEKKTFHDVYMKAAENEDTHLNTTQLLQKYQYAVEEHTVKTDDGYILTLFRIPPKQKTRDVQKRPVVFLMHGLLGSADDWLLSGPGVALAYLLADADYDVWMGNARGNKYSRRHVSKHPAQPEFWQFSIDEIALHDLPAMIDYALNYTHQENMYYVGFSEGTTTFFALASSRPEYNDKVTMMYALSPMVYMSHTRSPLLKMIAPNSPFYERLHQILGHGEFKPSQEMIQTVGGDMLSTKFGCKNVASNVMFVMAGMVDNYDAKITPIIVSHLPAGASTRQMKQYGQAVATHEFRRYDYGPTINTKVYGSELPPKYDMTHVRVPVSLYYSPEDWLVQPADVDLLVADLPHAMPHLINNFSHLDFQFSKAAPEAVYQRLIASIEKNQEQKIQELV